ncbi:MAG: hypothetical protein A2428_00605 [Bdellovibrionales bacterium RIFOXYC1_FULL_54_43]|nr:MAG: hypothetical protein A2428_00605 [Bdellovibrionales bacterium RIFOXYC1_FULL_54_43]OFZ83863.1 MAG: hypothetical protein A2603_09045 [Bdellovibrionales bacterium RIFOXYD1_FULL_55_31]
MESSSQNPKIVDSHVHVFPNLIRPDLIGKLPIAGPLGRLRAKARELWTPLSSSMHYSQTVLRHLPESARQKLDELSGVAPILGLFIESTASDLVQAMDRAGVDSAWVIAHPPLISNEFVMTLCERNPRLHPVVNIPKNTPRPATQLKSFVKHGAKLLKIHPAADGLPPESPFYKKLLKTASDLGIPVIIHTGCIHSHLLYKTPEFACAELFTPWFKEYAQTRFILAHMNFHQPHIAFDLAEEHLNLYMDTSWQPAEVIGESVRRLGAERILFGSDWPFIGGNLDVGLARIRDCVNSGTLNAEQSKLILGENAIKLLTKI